LWKRLGRLAVVESTVRIDGPAVVVAGVDPEPNRDWSCGAGLIPGVDVTSTAAPMRPAQAESYDSHMGWREQTRSSVAAGLQNPWTLAVALFIAAEVELVFLDALEHRGVAVVMAPLITLPIGWRRRAPLVATLVSMAAFASQSVLGVSDNGQFVPLVALILVTASLGRYGSTVEVVAGWAISVVLGAVAVAATPDDGPSDYAFAVLLVTGSVCAGALLRQRSDEAASHARRAELAEETSEERAREAAETERRRIARELHDVVAHAISLMVLQAGAAETLLDSEPDAARQGLRTIQDQGRAALVDMHHLLGVLRRPDGDTGLAPQPSLRDLPSLAAQFEAAGLPVEIDVDVVHGRLAPSVEVSVYRVIREALTNVLRHAGPATAHVHVTMQGRCVDVVVRDDGRPEPSDPSRAAGYGLVGMRERLALFGGELHAGPHADGGFEVRARFPADAGALVP
jgi:signal transduction histidine kinase